MNVEERVKNVIVDCLDVDITKLTEDADFIDNLGADSLDRVEVIMKLESDFRITIPDEEAETVKTVGQAIRKVQEKVDAKE